MPDQKEGLPDDPDLFEVILPIIEIGEFQKVADLADQAAYVDLIMGMFEVTEPS